MRYNDVHVLENHHCCVAFQLLDGAQLLAPLGGAERRTVRKTVVEAILHTDMAVHKELLSRVERRLSGEASLLSRDVPDDRLLLVAFLLHCADLCNPLLPPAMSRRIAERLGVEFEGQAAMERAADLQVTVMLAPEPAKKADMECGCASPAPSPLPVIIRILAAQPPTRPAQAAAAQLSALTAAAPCGRFITYVVRPLYVVLAKVAPDLASCVARVVRLLRACALAVLRLPAPRSVLALLAAAMAVGPTPAPRVLGLRPGCQHGDVAPA